MEHYVGTSAAMYSSSSSSGPQMPLLKEPTALELSQLDTLADVFTWARLPGTIGYAGSPAGSLVVLLGGDIDTDIAEFASVGLNDLEGALVEWMHSGANDPEPDDMEAAPLNVAPTPLARARARTRPRRRTAGGPVGRRLPVTRHTRRGARGAWKRP